MFCRKCGAQIEDNLKFCTKCGFNLSEDSTNPKQQNNNVAKAIKQTNAKKPYPIIALLAVGVLILAYFFVFPNVFERAKILSDARGDFYIDKNGYRVFNSWVKYKGKDYHINTDGYIDKNTWVDSYFLDDKGQMLKDAWTNYQNHFYYLKSDGTYAHDEIIEVDKLNYGFNTHGILYQNTFFEDPKNRQIVYYANQDGVIQIDSFADINGFTYYFDKNGNTVKNGWHEINNEWYYFLPGGELIKSSWVENKYYVDENGKMLRNAKAPNGIALDKDGEIIPGQSMIEGTVVMLIGGRSGLRTIEGAKVDFYEANNASRSVGTTYTDTVGKYQYYLPKGNYKIVINAPGYETIDTIETVNENENKYTELISLFPSGQTGNGLAAGRLTNALDGQPVPLATLQVRKNWNSFNGELATSQKFYTDASGNFTISDLPVGYYTIEASKDKFITGYCNIAMLKDNPITDNNFSLNPEMPNDGNIRIVLSWGVEPTDLDSHLIGRKPSGSFFDVYYSNKVYDYNGVHMANLDVDDTSSYGPETETITSDLNGTYVYGVHDFSNGGSANSYKLSYSNCRVTVYMGSQVVAVYNVPTGKVGTFWEVFRINEDRSITPINLLYNYTPSSDSYDRFNLPVRTNPKYSSIETVSSSNTSSSQSTSSGNQNTSDSGFALAYGTYINETYDYDENNEVKIKIRRPKIENGNVITLNSINSNIGYAMDDLIGWCQEYINNASSAPRTININTSNLVTANSSMVKINMNGKVTFKGSNEVEDINFEFIYDIDDDSYTLNEI